MDQHPDRWLWLRSFLSELKRRKVFRVAVAYGAVAFVVWQAAEFVLPALGFPARSVDLVVVLTLLGFPVALVLAWAFEVTPDGIRTTSQAVSERATFPQVDDEGWSASRRAVTTAALGIGFGILAFGGYALLRAVVPSGDDSPEIRSLAVLPLQNLAPDAEAEEYFTAGMHEALIAELAKIDALKVISRTSAMHFKGTERRLPEIARELDVDGLVEGSVLRAGDEVRITVQLLHGPTDRHLWSNSYERELADILTLQGEVARAIAEEIQITLDPEVEARLASRRTVDPEGYQLWLKGNYHLTRLNEESFRRALNSYREAIEIDPTYAPAHAGMAMAYITLAGWWSSLPPSEFYPQARAAAERALSLDSTVAEAHIALGRINQLFEWDWVGAERAFRRGVELNPEATFSRIVYANFLTSMGQFEESIEMGRRTLELDPLSPLAHNELGFAYQLAGRDDEALRMFGEGLKLDSDFPQTHGLLADFHMRRGQREKARMHLSAIDTTRLPPGQIGWVGYIHAATGQRREARAILSRLTELRKERFVPAMSLVLVHLGLGELEEALRWLETAYEERNVWLVWLFKGPMFDPLRSEPRFQVLLRRMDFREE